MSLARSKNGPKKMDSTTKEALAQVADGGAVTVGVSAFFGLLPDLAAVLSIIWLTIRIYESKTVQKFLKRNQ
jgi:hypothetical protein